MASDKAPAIGIDLGTTYSCVGVLQSGKVEIIANNQGDRTTPSWVAYTDSDRFVGDPAKRQVAMNPGNTIYDVKRLIGRRFDEQSVQEDIKHWPFDVVNSNGKPKIKLNFSGREELVHPELISSLVLSNLKETAESFLGKTVRDAVVTVPAYFNDSQRQATRDACVISGLNILRMINEPTAAAIAYGLDTIGEEQRTILVFDLGGGTFDVSLLNVDDGIFEVKATAGDTHLGGQDFDNRMVAYLVQEFTTKYDKDISKNKRALSRLSKACEVAKRDLSSAKLSRITIECLHEGIDFQTIMSRARFEELNSDLFQRTLAPVNQVLMDSGICKDNVDDIVLVGGSTRIPKIQQLLQNCFPGKELNKNINPDEAVACGAALHAAFLHGDKPGRLKDLVLIDVCPLSLGIEVTGGVMSTVIKRNTVIPVKETQAFTTPDDDMTKVDISVYEGERPLTKDNHLLRHFFLKGIPPLPAQQAKIDITLEVDVSGILEVTAVSRDSGSRWSVNISNNRGRLPRKEIEQMIRDSVKYKDADDKQRVRIASMEMFRATITSIRNALDNQQSKFSTTDQESVRKECKGALNWYLANQMDDKERFESERNDLLKACKAIFERAGVALPWDNTVTS